MVLLVGWALDRIYPRRKIQTWVGTSAKAPSLVLARACGDKMNVLHTEIQLCIHGKMTTKLQEHKGTMITAHHLYVYLTSKSD